MPAMHFALSEDEAMILDAAEAFGREQLRANERRHESAGQVDESVIMAFEDTGLAAVFSGELEVSGPARMLCLAALAKGDGAAALSLWMRAWCPVASESFGARSGFVHLVESLERWPIPCLPVDGAREVLFVEPDGRWGRAELQATPTRSLGLQAAGPSELKHLNWLERGAGDPARLLAELRVGVAALLTGQSRAALEYSSAYVQERVAFGRRVADHQGVGFLIADAAMSVEAAELMVCRSAWELDEGRLAGAADAWLEAAECALATTSLGVQLLGGHGYMKDHPVEKWMRDARALSHLWGGVDRTLSAAMGA